MTALILFAHGSRRPEARPVLEDMVALMHEKMPLTRLDVPPQTCLAWLDLDEPSLDTVCTKLAAADETQALAVPLLFIDAFHSRVNVPEQVWLCDHRGIGTAVAERLGLGDGTKHAVVERVIEAAEDASFSWPVDALAVRIGSFDEGTNVTIHQFVANLDGMLPEHVSTALVVNPKKIEGADTVAATQERAAKRGHGFVMVPLFTAPGLLWNRAIDAGAAAGAGQVAFGEPLTGLLAPVVCCRWDPCATYVDVQVVV